MYRPYCKLSFVLLFEAADMSARAEEKNMIEDSFGRGGEEEEEEEEEEAFRWQKGRRMFLQHMATSWCVCVWARREVRTRFWWRNFQKETTWNT